MCRGAKRSAVWATALAVLAVGGCALADAQAPFILTVQPHHNLQHAIEMAPEGAVVHLAAGTWETHLDISKSLTLRGSEDGSTIRGLEGDAPVIRVHTPGEDEIVVVLDGLTVTGGEDRHGPGLRLEGSAQVMLTNATIERNGLAGVWIQDTTQATIEGSAINGSFGGIRVWDSAQATVANSTVEDNAFGVSVSGTAVTSITDSTIAGNELGGISVGQSAQVTIANSTIERNGEAGLSLSSSAHGKIENTSIQQNGASGVRISGPGQATITDSIIERNGQYGITIWGSAHAAIQNTAIEHNGASGVRVSEFARASIASSTIASNRSDGLTILDYAEGSIRDSNISANGADGILLRYAAVLTLVQSSIRRSGRYGIALHEMPCYEAAWPFTGFVSGRGNSGEGNAEGDYCPEALAFLFTEEGGELDRREE